MTAPQPDATPSRLVRGAGVTAIGGRAENQDAFLADYPVFIVADGMGGHAAGGEAARAVTGAFAALAQSPAHAQAHGGLVTPADVERAHADARAAVAQVAREHRADSGSTLTGAIVVHHNGEPWWMVINVGDSRVYALDGGVLSQVTIDHSHVQDLVDAGYITPAQALIHPERNLLTRAMGDDLPTMDTWLVPLRPGRRLIIASDGLMKEIEDPTIGRIASLVGDPAAAAEALVDAAVAMGARDNVTVVVADCLGSTGAGASAVPWRQWGQAADAWHDDPDTSPSERRS